MREIVTIQAGGYANYVGSHFWNFQDELLGLAEEPVGDPIYKNMSLDMDVLYRAGETLQGILTYTPRLVSINSQGSLGSMSSCGSLYYEIPSMDPSHVTTWHGSVSKNVSEPFKKNLFLQSLYKDSDEPTTSTNDGTEDKDQELVECLQNGVNFWTDFSKLHYHPKSLYELSGISSGAQECDNYGTGKDVFSEGSCGEEMNDRLRFFVEECGNIQGIQFIVDDSGIFSSVATDFLENIADDFTKTPVLLYSAKGPIASSINLVSRRHSILRALQDAISFTRLSSYSKLFVPIGLPSLSRSELSTFLSIEDAKQFHSSAVYAAALHSTSLPFRMRTSGPCINSRYATGAMNIDGLVSMLAGQGRQNMVATLDIAMPAPPLIGAQKQRSFLRSLHSLTPDITKDVEDMHALESINVHGVLHSDGRLASIHEVKDSISSAYESAETQPKFSHLSVALCPLPIPLPFPSIFRNSVGKHGELLRTPVPGLQSRGSLDIHSIPMATRLRSSTAILPFIQNHLGNLRKFGIERGAQGSQILQSWGLEKDQLEDMGESLSKMIMALDPLSEESSDSD